MFCVADGFAGSLLPAAGAQRRDALPAGEPWLPRLLCVVTPAHAGKIFSKNGMGWMLLTSVPAAAALESMVAAWKYFVLLAGSFKFVGMARSTCKGKRRPMLPT